MAAMSMPRATRSTPRRRWRPSPSTGRSAAALGRSSPRSASEVLTTLAGKVAQGDVDQYQPVPLGFTPLDKTIGGGLRAGELLLIGGAQGTGKTTMAVQMARNIVMGGQASVLYVCYEHDEEYLLNRIIAMESALQHLPGRVNGRQAPGRAQGDPEHVAGAGRGLCRPDGQPPPPACPRTGQSIRPEPVHAARLADQEHGREPAPARPALQGPVGRPTAGRVHRLHAEGARSSPIRRPRRRR